MNLTPLTIQSTKALNIMNKLRNILVIVFFILQQVVNAQSSVIDCNSDLQLLNYLTQKGRNAEALSLSADMALSPMCINKIDSIHFLKGMAFYQLQMFDSASNYFQKIEKPDTISNRAKFMGALTSSYIGKHDLAKGLLRQVTVTSKPVNMLLNIEKAGNGLLLRDFVAYENAAKTFSYSYYALLNEEKKLEIIYQALKKEKFKSPITAACLSAIVPGAGKWYCNRKGKAIASFLTVAVLSAITIEQGTKSGWTDYRTIAAGATTSLFHIGNIYGSYYETKYHNKRLNHEIDESILYNMDISVRNIYY